MGIMKRQEPVTETVTAAAVDYSSIKAVVACSIIMSLLATVFVWLRFWIRRSRGQLGLEDWLIISSMPFMYGTMITALIAVYRGGLGYSILVIIAVDPAELGISLQCLFTMEILYAILITLVKLSVLAMYRSIFPTSTVNKGTFVLGTLVLFWWLAVTLVTFLQCRPLYGLWSSTDVPPQCMNKLGLFVGNAVPNIIIDVFILGLPLYEVARLQMTWTKKIGICVIFLFGSITILVSGLRLRSGLALLSNENSDFTFLVGPLWAWTVIEPAMGIISACMPTVGGPILGIIAKRITLPKPTPRNKSTTKNISLKTIATVGGGSARAINRPAFSNTSNGDGTGPFERLGDDSQEALPRNLWPQGYHEERHTSVSGRRTPSDGSGDAPLTSITVKQELTWTESKASDASKPI